MILDAVVRPNSRKFEAKLHEGNKLTISLTSPPERNRANIELVKELSKLLGCEVRIVGGFTSKRKALSLAIDENEMKRRLAQGS